MYATSALVVVLTVLTFSYAADRVPTAKLQAKFNEADCNHDKKLSLKEGLALAAAYGESAATATKQFHEGDKNHDRELDFSEYKALVNTGETSITPKAGAPKLCS